MNIIKKILKIVLWTLLILIVTYNIYTFFSLKILKKNITSFFGYSVLEVVSGSMEPTINISDLIVINQNKNNYKKNDIITFVDENEKFVTHRIVDVTKKGFITKGDANKNVDLEYVSKNKIVGTYVFKINKFGSFIKAVKNPIVLSLIFIIGIMVCVVISNNINLKVSEEEKEFLKLKNK